MSKKLPYKGNSRLKNNNFFNSGIERLLARINSIELETFLGAGPSTPLPEFRAVDVDGLLEAVMSAAVDPEDWKASYTIAFPADDVVVNGQFETNGDFLTEESTWNLVGIGKTTGKNDRTTVLASSNFKPTGGSTLNGIEISTAGNVYDFDNSTWTYKYEEDPTATGSDPMYLHDFTINLESTQINGYVVIGADDSVIAVQFDGFIPSMGEGDPGGGKGSFNISTVASTSVTNMGGGSCDASLNFTIGLSSFDANSNVIGVDTFTGNDYFGALEIRSVEGSPVTTSYVGPSRNLDFYMPVVDQSASDTYEYILTLTDYNTGCTYCASAVGNPMSITLVIGDLPQSEFAYNDEMGMGCGTINPPLP